MKQFRLYQNHIVSAVCIVIAIGLFWQWQAAESTPPIDNHFESPAYAIHTSFWWRPEIVWRDLDTVNEMGFGWVKQAVAWRDIEGIEKGSYDWYRMSHVIVPAVEERDLKLLVRLDRQPQWSQADPSVYIENAPPANYEDYGDFCGAIASEFKGRIHAYQVWNEPNLHREWGYEKPDPVAYTRLLQSCYENIKKADPDAIVISAGLAPTATNDDTAMPDSDFLHGMYAAGAAEFFDVLGLNAPGYKAPPTISADDVAKEGYGDHREFAFRHVEDMRAIMVEYSDETTQVAILEMGWITDDQHGIATQSLAELHNSYAWFAVDPNTQAEYLVGAYEYARENWTPWIGLMTTVYLADFDWTPENHEQWWWSIVLPDGTPRPAFHALSEMEKQP